MQRRSMYLCIECSERCSDNCGPSSIECSACQGWVHRRCVPVAPEIFQQWGEKHMRFLCKPCAFTDNGFNVEASLGRMSSSDQRAVAAKSERLLMETYGVDLPQTQPMRSLAELPKASLDVAVRDILKKYHPAILNSHQPLYVEGDGNCFFRAVCLAAFGSVDYHELLRLKVTQEVLFNPQYYDNSRADYVDVFNDNRIVLENYDYMLSNVLVLNRPACMHTMAATSCVLGAPIQSYCPPNKGNFFASDPLTRSVVGRGVRPTLEPAAFVMWSMGYCPKKHDHFRPTILLSCAAAKSAVTTITLGMMTSVMRRVMMRREVMVT